MNALEKYAAKQVLIEKLAIIAGAMRLGKRVGNALSTPVGELADVVTRPGRTLKKVFPGTSRQISDAHESARTALRNAPFNDRIPKPLRKALYRSSMKAEDMRRVLNNKEYFARKKFPKAMKGLDKVDDNVRMARAGFNDGAVAKRLRQRNLAGVPLPHRKDFASSYRLGLGARRAIDALKRTT